MIKLQVPLQEHNIFTGYIDFCIAELGKFLSDQNCSLYSTDEFKLYYYIKENIMSNIYYFCNVYLDLDSMGFIPVKRNIRISSESLLDMYNLINVADYKTVLSYMDNKKKCRFDEKFKEFIFGKNFSVISKLNIAKKITSVVF